MRTKAVTRLPIPNHGREENVTTGRDDSDSVEITVEGENVGEGDIDLAALAVFANGFQRAMRGLAAQVRERPSRGRPAKGVARASGLRLVALRKGSTTLVLRPASRDAFGALAKDTLDKLQRVVDSTEEPVTLGVVTALEEARRGLGSDGKFAVRHGPNRSQLVFDGDKLQRLRERAQHARLAESIQEVVVSGWLHMVDVKPDEVVIETPEGVEWRSTYPPSLEPAVRSLIGEVVVVTGKGVRTGSGSGRLEMETVDSAPQLNFDETYLESGLRSDSTISALMDSQGVRAPQSAQRPSSIDDHDAQAFVDALARLHESH